MVDRVDRLDDWTAKPIVLRRSSIFGYEDALPADTNMSVIPAKIKDLLSNHLQLMICWRGEAKAKVDSRGALHRPRYMLPEWSSQTSLV